MWHRLMTLIFTIAPLLAFSQTRVADSLKILLAKSKGEARLSILNQLAYEMIDIDNRLANQYCDQAIQLGKSINSEKLMGVAYTQKGVNAYLAGHYSEALQNLKSGLTLALKTADRNNQGYTLLQLGNCYLNKGFFDSTKLYYDKAYHILKDSANPLNLSKLYRNLSVMYRFSNNYEMQKKYIDRALKINYALHNQERVIDITILKAVLFSQLTKFDSANITLDWVEQMALKLPDKEKLIYEVNYNRLLIAIAQGKYEKAFHFMDLARSYLDKNNFPKKKTVFFKNVGRVFGLRGDYELSLQNLYEGLAIADSENFIDDKIDIICNLGWSTHFVGDYEKSLSFAEEALKYATRYSLPNFMMQALNLKGTVLTDLKRYEEGRTVLRANIDTCNKYNNYISLMAAYSDWGNLEIMAGRPADAVPILLKGIILAQDKNEKRGQLWIHLSLAKAYIELKLLPAATQELTNAEKLEKLLQEKEALIEIYNTKKSLLKAQGKFQQSLYYAELAIHLRDSIRSMEVTNRFVNLQHLDEISQRETNIKILTQQKEISEAQIKLKDSRLQVQYIIVATVIIAMVVFLVAALRFRNFYKRIVVLNKNIQEQNEEIQAQSEELTQSNSTISKMNQHLEAAVEEKTSNLKTANEELIRSNNNLQQFSYVVSHNLRGPIARLLGLTSILKTLPPGDEQSKFVELTHKSSTDLDNIVTDLSKIINLKGGTNLLEPVNLRTELEISIQQNALPESHHKDVLVKFDEDITARSVKAFIQSIFYNLLNNAYKYRSPDRPLKIMVEAKKVNDVVEILVSDNGLGIDLTKHREAVFKLFKRFHLNADGRGLGLYLVKEQIESVGGTIDIQSEPDVGTTFIIRHPL
ncbi:MAG: hypothetical protein JST43_12190 [Bacteroidetes bacterium]|nr:hypothetical protein [Bacteroidota bacterium]MBS1541650.1 hypothetical protein [Bacteroidota bacterium]